MYHLCVPTNTYECDSGYGIVIHNRMFLRTHSQTSQTLTAVMGAIQETVHLSFQLDIISSFSLVLSLTYTRSHRQTHYITSPSTKVLELTESSEKKKLRTETFDPHVANFVR